MKTKENKKTNNKKPIKIKVVEFPEALQELRRYTKNGIQYINKKYK